MFKSYPASSESKLVLKEPIYLWMKAWENGSIGLWKDFGSTTLTGFTSGFNVVACSIRDGPATAVKEAAKNNAKDGRILLIIVKLSLLYIVNKR